MWCQTAHVMQERVVLFLGVLLAALVSLLAAQGGLAARVTAEQPSQVSQNRQSVDYISHLDCRTHSCTSHAEVEVARLKRSHQDPSMFLPRQSRDIPSADTEAQLDALPLARYSPKLGLNFIE
jgi:hypothetical protein